VGGIFEDEEAVSAKTGLSLKKQLNLIHTKRRFELKAHLPRAANPQDGYDTRDRPCLRIF
jgi:hypothetical protein